MKVSDAQAKCKAKNPACPVRIGREHACEACSGYQLYTKVKGDAKAEMGKCLVIPGVLVYGAGWCNSFSSPSPSSYGFIWRKATSARNAVFTPPVIIDY